MAENSLRTKNLDKLIAESKANAGGLKQTLTGNNLILLGIGAIIGAGIFVMTGKAAADHAGPALALSFVFSGMGCAFAGLCYAEFAAMIPSSGSAYTYAYTTLGEVVAWVIGWMLILEYMFGASTVAASWSKYLTEFLDIFGVTIPDALCHPAIIYDSATGFTASGALINLPSVIIVGMATTLLVVGIKESASFNNIIVFIKVAVVLLFIGFGIYYVKPENWQPFIPENTGKMGEYGWSGIVAGAATIFFAYIGFDAVSTAAQEAKNPQKDMPRGIMISLIICTILYILVSLVMTGLAPYMDYKGEGAPIAVAMRKVPQLEWLAPWITFGALAGLTSVILVMLMGMPRVFFSMANDGLLPRAFTKVHAKYQTPYVTTILTGVAAGILSGLFPVGLLGDLVNIGTLAAFAIVCIAVLVLRAKRPDVHRPFKTPWVPVIPIAGALICGLQMLLLPRITWILLAGWLVIGFTIYFFYGRSNSLVGQGKN